MMMEGGSCTPSEHPLVVGLDSTYGTASSSPPVLRRKDGEE